MGFLFFSLKDHANAGKYFLYNNKQANPKAECLWGMMIPGLMIQFTVWEASLAVSHTLGESKGPPFTQKEVISTDH